MDKKIDYCQLLKSTCDLKQQIDKLVNTDHDKIGMKIKNIWLFCHSLFNNYLWARAWWGIKYFNKIAKVFAIYYKHEFS